MKDFLIVLILTGGYCIVALIPHDHIQVNGCFESDAEFEIGTDGEEDLYADFQDKEIVSTYPKFVDGMQLSPDLFDLAVSVTAVCKANLVTAIKAEKNPLEAKVPPQTIIYHRDEVNLGEENTLICQINHFYPPTIKVKWTKNEMEVTEGVTLSRYYPNDDGSFYQFSRLMFTPQEGDMYGCTVEHVALTEPETKIWVSEVSQPSVGPAVFCGVGLTLGLLGVATGTFFLIKGNECN